MRAKSLFGKALFILAVTWFLFTPHSGEAANPLAGEYFGTVTIDSPAGLGNIDLAVHLELDDAGNIVPDSYIILEKTLLFPAVAPQVDGKDVGPRVDGNFDVLNGLQLTTQSFETRIFPGTDSERTVVRTFTLDGDTIAEGGNSISGNYTESMTGYLPEPINVTGTFVLIRPASVTEGLPVCQDSKEPFGVLDIDEIRAGGHDPAIVEFEDICCAIEHRQNPGSGLTVSDDDINSAISEYRSTLE